MTRWLEDRFPVRAILDLIASKKVPMHSRSFWYQTGGILLILFGVQVATGILLMVYYQPGTQTSHASVQFIMTQVKFGWLVRSIHSWSANLMILLAFVHMFAKVFTRAYRKPREMTWVTGVALLGLLYAFGFIGYLLPWDKLSYFATQVGMNTARATPLIGPALVRFIQGGDHFTSLTLTRFYTLHVAVLPLVMLAVAGSHITFIQLQGESAPDAFAALPEERRAHIPFFPDFAIREMALHVFILATLAALAVGFPWPLGPEANTLDPTPIGIKPEWYFLPQYLLLRLLPSQVGPINSELMGLILINAAAFVWILLPFWDRRGRLGVKAGAFALLTLIVMTYFGWIAR